MGGLGFFFGRETSPAFPACSEVGQKKVHGRDFWCGQLGVWKDGETEEKQVQGHEAVVTQTDLQNLRCRLRERPEDTTGNPGQVQVTECKGSLDLLYGTTWK